MRILGLRPVAHRYDCAGQERLHYRNSGAKNFYNIVRADPFWESGRSSSWHFVSKATNCCGPAQTGEITSGFNKMLTIELQGFWSGATKLGIHHGNRQYTHAS